MAKTKTYYIVESFDNEGDKQWMAHTGFWADHGVYRWDNWVHGSLCWEKHGSSADECERKLRKVLANQYTEPRVVRVLKI